MNKILSYILHPASFFIVLFTALYTYFTWDFDTPKQLVPYLGWAGHFSAVVFFYLAVTVCGGVIFALLYGLQAYTEWYNKNF